MKEYLCKICNYKTTDRSNWAKHKKSSKHLEKVHILPHKFSQLAEVSHSLANRLPVNNNKSNTGDTIRHLCTFCNMDFAHKSSLSKHKKRCADKKMQEKDKEIENKLKKKEFEMIYQENSLIKQRMSDMERMILTLQETMHEAVKTRSEGVSLMGTLIGPLKNNPPLKQIDQEDFDNYIRPNSRLIKEIMACFIDQTLHEFVGKFILNKVKKKNLHEQSIFASDTSRQTYYIKEIILKNKSEWVLDKQGIRVKKILISPVTMYLFSLVDNYFNKDKPNFEEMDIVDKEMFIRDKTEVLKLSKEIDNGKLDEKINKFLCPHLQIDIDKFKTIKEEKKVPTLEFDKVNKK